MSARRLLALLVVVVLGLLLVCPTAFSRPETPLQTVGGTGDFMHPGDDDDEDDDDDDNPNGFVGDDDNWDKSAIRGHSEAESFDGSGGAYVEVGSSSSEMELSRTEIGLGVRLALLLQSWVLFSSLR